MRIWSVTCVPTIHKLYAEFSDLSGDHFHHLYTVGRLEILHILSLISKVLCISCLLCVEKGCFCTIIFACIHNSFMSHTFYKTDKNMQVILEIKITYFIYCRFLSLHMPANVTILAITIHKAKISQHCSGNTPPNL